ncbi:leucine-rich repeat domain-containing protein, partial [Candidatus Dependentiae bacterium]
MKVMKYISSPIIILAVLACFGQALFAMEETPTLPEGTPTFLENFAQLPKNEQEMITLLLSDSDLVRLAQTSKQASKVLEDELAQRHLQAAIELSLWESRIKIDFSSRIRNYPSLDQFRQAVLNTLAKTAQQHPEQWISLNLNRNNLGSLSSKELKEFFQYIAKYNVVELNLFYNQLTSLPENIFNQLHNLIELHLSDNQL